MIMVYARKTFLAWQEWTAALFGLEKENSQRKFNQAVTILVFCVLLVVGIFVINTFITPAVPGVHQMATPTIDLTQSAQTATPTQVVPTIEVTAQGLIPTITSYLGRGCVPDQIDWTDPQNGGSISGKVELKGTINIQDLGFYKYEFAAVGSDTWTTIAAGSTKITDGSLGGAWDTSSLVPGDYQLRLIVTDNQNEQLPACVIQITVKAAD
jgi:hypothetical protein